MKKSILALMFLLFSGIAFSQTTVTLQDQCNCEVLKGTDVSSSGAVTPTGADLGDIYVNTNTGTIYFWDGNSWELTASDSQQLTGFTFNDVTNILSLSLEDGGNVNVDLSSLSDVLADSNTTVTSFDIDGTNTNLVITDSDANSYAVALADLAALINTDNQTLNEVLVQGNDAGGSAITNLADPTAAQDAATKAYVDSTADDDITGVSFNGGTNEVTVSEGATSFSADLSSLEESADIAANASDIATNTAAISTNTTDIAANTADITTNASNISTNTTNISANAADITTNTADIATNASDIATNTTDIATNTAAIATNTTDIATNTTDIANHIAADGDLSSTNEIQNIEEVLTDGNDANGLVLTGLGAPTVASDAATKAYVDSTADDDITGVSFNGGTNEVTVSEGATSFSADLSSLEESADIAANASDIATNALDIATNTADISTNASNISTNTTDIATNASDISTNTTDIATNTTDITTNASNISTNASDIATNTTDIATNASDIATNASDIATNTADISTNASNISTNTTDIATNTAAISTNTTDIATNTTDITTNASNISTNASDIATNTTDIATNASDISTNTTNITANTADITTNASDIATNTAAIATNTTDIANHIAADGDLSSTNEIQNIEEVLTDGNDANGLVLTGLGAPTAASDAATKAYVDSTADDDITGVSFNGGTNEVTVSEGATSFSADLSSLEESADIAANAADIATNASNISTNTTNITANTADVSTNTADIATNMADIATNAADISTNTTDIATNTAAIATNTTDIATNTTDIANHIAADGDLSSTNEIQNIEEVLTDGNDANGLVLTGLGAPTAASDAATKAYVDSTADDDITGVSFNGGTNEVTVSEGATSFSADLSSLEESADIAANAADIATNAADITTNASNISTNTTNITANTADISTNTADIATNTADIATNTTDIATNTSDITINTADIATNASDIATNTTDIANHIAADGDLSSTNEIQDAIDVPYDASTTTLTSTNVQNVIEELKSEVDAFAATSGQTNTASNVGSSGTGLFARKTGADLEFKNINAGSNKITITDDGANDEVDIDINEANLTVTSDLATHIAADGDLSSTNEIQNIEEVLTDGNDANGLVLTGLGAPTAASDAATKAYVDSTADDDITGVSFNGGTNEVTVSEGATSFSADLSSLEESADIAANAADIATNASNISTNTTNITANTADVSTNASDIATNTTDITTNAADISTNTTDIATNTAAIATNTTDIATNTTDIANHIAADGDLSSTNEIQNIEEVLTDGNDANGLVLTGLGAPTAASDAATKAYVDSTADDDITGVSFNGGTNEVTVSEGATSFSADLSSLEESADIAANAADIATNAADITTNASNISTNTTNITANTADISTNTADIATNTADIATNTADIATNTTDIATNTSDITINTADIATNASDIATNTTDIANHIAADGDLSSTNEIQDAIDVPYDASTTTLTSTNVQNVIEELKSEVDAFAATSGQTNTASNVGSSGTGLFARKTGADLEFKNINAGSNKITITDDGANDEVDIDINEANLTVTSDLATHIAADGDLSSTNEIQNIEEVLTDGNDANGLVLTGLGAPTAASDAATKAYVDSTADDDITGVSFNGGTNEVTVSEGATSFSADLSSLEESADIAANAADIATNTAAISTNTTDIATNTTDITTNASNISTNASDIATNTTDIATNASDISTNTTNITANTADITTNASDIATNTADIATNTTDIANHIAADGDLSSTNEIQNIEEVLTDGNDANGLVLTGLGAPTVASDAATKAYVDSTADDDITGVSFNGGTNEVTVSEGATSFSADLSSLEESADIAANAADIAANTADITTNASNISTNTTNIATNTADITTNVSDIATNTADIATNTTDIATNTAAIATNTTDIANHIAADGDLSSTNEIQNIEEVLTDGNDANGLVLTGLGAPTVASDAATKAYVDSTADDDITGVSFNGGTNEVTVSEGATSFSADLSSLEESADIAANAADIATNMADITTNASNISTNTTDIATNTAAISTNTTDIATNTTDITTNASNISTNASDIATNTTDIATNASDISTNTTNITANTADITTNASDIATNTAAIATNTTDIATNTTDIANHIAADGDLSSTNEIQNIEEVLTDGNDANGLVLTGLGAPTAASDAATKAYVDSTADDDITGVSFNGGTNEVTVSEGATSFSADLSSLEESADIAANASDIATNASDIATNTADIATNASDIATNTADIATNMADIATNAADISTNTTDIATNTAAIATNTADIATNTTDIANHIAADGDLSSTNEIQNIEEVLTDGNDANGLVLTGLGAPTAASDAATKAYVDSTADDDITGVSFNGGTNEVTVSEGATSFSADLSSLEESADIAANAADIATNMADITTNASNISTNTTNIATNTADITTNASDIATNTADITTNASNISTNVSDIATNTADIATNTTDIATNTADITTNTADIATNTTDIANHIAADGDLSSTNEIQNIEEVLTDGNDANGLVLTGLGAPTAASDAATKAYVDSTADDDITGVSFNGGTNEVTVSEGATSFSADLSSLEESADIAANAADIATNASDIATNTADITTNASNISTNTTNISANAADISTNTTDIATNASNISANASDIATNTADITTNTADISTNASNISSNTTNIVTNASDISTNTTNITANTADITTNTADIATNASDIATNTTDIANHIAADGDLSSTNEIQNIEEVLTDGNDANGLVLTGLGAPTAASDAATKAYVDSTADDDITGVSFNGGTNEVTVSEGATSFSADLSSLEESADIAANAADIATNTADISTNAADISTNTTDIATNTADITTNASDIATNTAAISTNTTDIATNTTDITTNASNISTNASDIATNTTDIATNTAAIATNTTDIANHIAADGDLSSTNEIQNIEEVLTDGNDANGLVLTGLGAPTAASDAATKAYVDSTADDDITGVSFNGGTNEVTVSEGATSFSADLSSLEESADIAANAADIATNTADIATNTTDIATNTAAIATNTTDIANHIAADGDLSSTNEIQNIEEVLTDGNDANGLVLTGLGAPTVASDAATKAYVDSTADDDITGVSFNGGTNEVTVSEGATSFSADLSSLEESADIAANAADIATNMADISTNTTNITANTADISTNTTDIATNTADIATNASDIATNTTDIANHIAADGDLSSTNEINTRFEVNGTNLEIEDSNGTLQVPLTDINTDDQVASEVNSDAPIDVDGDGNTEATVEDVIQDIAPITSKAARIFYPPSIAIDASTNGTFSLDLYQEYIDQYGSPTIGSTGAPSAIPTYARTDLYYYVTYADPTVFDTGSMSIDANGNLSYTVQAQPSDYNALINVVFVVK